MLRRNSLLFVAAFAVSAVAAGVFATLHAQPPAVQAPPAGTDDDGVIRFLEKVAKAFNAGDAKALAALWSETGELIDEDADTRLSGRAEIEAAYAKSFDKDNPARLEIDLDKIRKVTADVVTLDGKITVLRKSGLPERSTFAAILVKKGGDWLLDQTREKDLPGEPSAAENLQELDWLTGSWKHVAGTTEILVDCTEVAGGNFRTIKYRVTEKGELAHEGTQVIGYDASRKQIRSWIFSSDGSFAEGTWESNTNRWTIRMAGVLPGGEKTSSVRIMAVKDKDHYTWHTVDRTVDGKSLPDQDEITMTRVQAVAVGVNPARKEK